MAGSPSAAEAGGSASEEAHPEPPRTDVEREGAGEVRAGDAPTSGRERSGEVGAATDAVDDAAPGEAGADDASSDEEVLLGGDAGVAIASAQALVVARSLCVVVCVHSPRAVSPYFSPDRLCRTCQGTFQNDVGCCFKRIRYRSSHTLGSSRDFGGLVANLGRFRRDDS